MNFALQIKAIFFSYISNEYHLSKEFLNFKRKKQFKFLQNIDVTFLYYLIGFFHYIQSQHYLLNLFPSNVGFHMGFFFVERKID